MNKEVDLEYYVYLHKKKSDNIVFYVGKGTASRHREKSKRSKAWKGVVDNCGGFYSEIYADNLDLNSALELENQLIENPDPGWALVNKLVFRNIDYNKNWADLFTYDESSKSCLRWKNCKYPARNGKEVGGYQKCGSVGYWNVGFDGRNHKIHRIIWTMFNGPIPDGFVINHINNDSLDNRLSNLELCTYSQNTSRSTISKNKEINPESYVSLKSFKHNINGVEFVYFAYCVNISRDKKRTNKVFSILKYGKEKAFELAKLYAQNVLAFGKEVAENKIKSFGIPDDLYISITSDKPLKSGKVPTIVKVNIPCRLLNISKNIVKQFNVDHYSTLEATLAVAKDFRDNKLKEYYDYSITNSTK